MRQEFCDICGSEINIAVVGQTKVFRITKNGNFKREDNNNVFGPEFVFQCSNDSCHQFKKDISDWKKDTVHQMLKSNLILI